MFGGTINKTGHYMLDRQFCCLYSPQMPDSGIQANCFRVRLAMEQCDSDYLHKAWRHYFSGITVVFLLVFRILISAVKHPPHNGFLG